MSLTVILTDCGCCSQNHIQLVLQDGVPLFFNQRDGPFMPTLKLLHQGAFGINSLAHG